MQAQIQRLCTRARLPFLMHRHTDREREKERHEHTGTNTRAHTRIHTHTHTQVCTTDPQEKIPQSFDIKFAAGICGGWYLWGPVCVGMFDKVCVCMFVGARACVCDCVLCFCCCRVFVVVVYYCSTYYKDVLCICAYQSVGLHACVCIAHPATCPPQTNNLTH
jgi:hypothetical protein